MIKVIFAGTPEFAVPSLITLIQDNRFQVIAVLTQPDRPKGRGQQLQQSPIKTLALKHHLPIFQPSTLKEFELQHTLKNLNADVMIVAAYGLLLPQAILDIPKHGCINVHGSVLPRWRGAAPVQRAIEAGDQKTGITLMQMDKGLDTGGIFDIKTCEITPHDTNQSLTKKLAELGANALLESLPKILSGEIKTTPQNESQATYAHKLEKKEGLIHWQENAEIIARKIRAFYPWPGCYFEKSGQTLKIGIAEVILLNQKNATPGTILQCDHDALIIACGKDALKILQIQFPGGKMQAVKNYLQSLQYTQ